MSKYSRCGGKYAGNHTTLIPAATIICDIANKCSEVVCISPGFLKAGLPSVNGQRRAKITDVKGGLLLQIRDNTTYQEVWVYTKNVEKARMVIARGILNTGLHIAFGNKRR